mmetsp:Transcript_88145/g.128868  ORF Transcript_88145/g.128868 Transcript_88145/m.128868 type:complete len:105 (+) Transcript_88145:190-504(+)
MRYAGMWTGTLSAASDCDIMGWRGLSITGLCLRAPSDSHTFPSAAQALIASKYGTSEDRVVVRVRGKGVARDVSATCGVCVCVCVCVCVAALGNVARFAKKGWE